MKMKKIETVNSKWIHNQNVLLGLKSQSFTMLSVEANSVNLINEGESSILVSDVTKLLEWADGTVHGVDSLEGNDLKNTQTSGYEKIHKLRKTSGMGSKLWIKQGSKWLSILPLAHWCQL